MGEQCWVAHELDLSMSVISISSHAVLHRFEVRPTGPPDPLKVWDIAFVAQ